MTRKRNHAVYRASLGFLILLCGTLLVSDFQQPGASSAPVGPAGMGRYPRKHPKLSTPLVHLARAVSQRATPLLQGEQLSAPPGFSIANLPKSGGADNCSPC